MSSMVKSFKLRNFLQDLEYTVFGTEVHAFLFKVYPPKEGMLILEPGCGSGKFGLAYALAGCETVMLDIDPEVLKYARRLRGALNCLVGFPLPTVIRTGNVHRLHYADNTFDLAFAEGLSHHWTDEERRQGSIDQMTRVSKDTVIVIGNNGANPLEVEKYGDVEFQYKGMPPKAKFFTPDELEMRLKKAGLKNVNVEPISPGKIEDSVLVGGYGRKH